VGVVGSVLGVFLAGLLGISATTGVLHLLAAFGGAVLLLFILGKVGVFKHA
jgi:uncharacterized membrane protein YeaQ/YmgE (transglycosylase-associated protein family)